MEAEDDMIILVVVDDNEKAKSSGRKILTTQPSRTGIEMDNMIETVQKHGEFMKIEPKDNEYQFDYDIDGTTYETESNQQPNVKEECEEEEESEPDNSDEEISDWTESNQQPNVKAECEEEETEPDNSDGEISDWTESNQQPNVKAECEEEETEPDNSDGEISDWTESNDQPNIKDEFEEGETEPNNSDEQISEEGETELENSDKEISEGETAPDNSDKEISEKAEYSPSQHRTKRRFTMVKPWQRWSFVAELRKQDKELRKDKELLINTLGGIMRTVKPPPPPKNFYVMNGTKFECAYCGQMMDTLPAASRHFQKKHGQRYLVCYACGVDFTWPGNLYKHEKRCIAPDAEIVLRARGVFLGRKGRGRPFLTPNKFTLKENEPTKFPCSMCSAVLICKSTLQSHENLHRGERPYRCQTCPAAYTSSSALSRHTKMHKDVQFLCDHCGRAFKVKGALISHMDTHNPIRKHGCEECNRRFAQKAALILHVNRVHRNLPPPCACQICPKRYPRMYLLKAHMKREHGMSIITRKMFFKTLPTMTELEIKKSNNILNKTKC